MYAAVSPKRAKIVSDAVVMRKLVGSAASCVSTHYLMRSYRRLAALASVVPRVASDWVNGLQFAVRFVAQKQAGQNEGGGVAWPSTTIHGGWSISRS